jgi:hypothetical protein
VPGTRSGAGACNAAWLRLDATYESTMPINRLYRLLGTSDRRIRYPTWKTCTTRPASSPWILATTPTIAWKVPYSVRDTAA